MRNAELAIKAITSVADSPQIGLMPENIHIEYHDLKVQVSGILLSLLPTFYEFWDRQ